jgi:hypothetical protein
MEQKRGQETKKQEKPLNILGQDEMSFIRAGDGNPPLPPPPPPPVENGDDD